MSLGYENSSLLYRIIDEFDTKIYVYDDAYIKF